MAFPIFAAIMAAVAAKQQQDAARAAESKAAAGGGAKAEKPSFEPLDPSAGGGSRLEAAMAKAAPATTPAASPATEYQKELSAAVKGAGESTGSTAPVGTPTSQAVLGSEISTAPKPADTGATDDVLKPSTRPGYQNIATQPTAARTAPAGNGVDWETLIKRAQMAAQVGGAVNSSVPRPQVGPTGGSGRPMFEALPQRRRLMDLLGRR